LSQRNIPVGIESVLSTEKYLPLTQSVRQRGGRIALIYVCLSSPALSLQRVRHRFAHGGHDVPADKIAERWQRSLEKLPSFLTLASRFWIYDNSDSDADLPKKLVAEGRNGSLSKLDKSRCFPELLDALTKLTQTD
jgi:predicted ABC-type ATPase